MFQLRILSSLGLSLCTSVLTQKSESLQGRSRAAECTLMQLNVPCKSLKQSGALWRSRKSQELKLSSRCQINQLSYKPAFDGYSDLLLCIQVEKPMQEVPFRFLFLWPSHSFCFLSKAFPFNGLSYSINDISLVMDACLCSVPSGEPAA